MDLRGSVTYARHTLPFDLPIPASTESNPDKVQLRETILSMRYQGMSYHQIGARLGIHWTRVGQVVKH